MTSVRVLVGGLDVRCTACGVPAIRVIDGDWRCQVDHAAGEGRGPLYVHGVAVPVPDSRRSVHLDGTECVAGYVGETMECASGGGVVVRMDAYDALKTPARTGDF